jgi:leucyl-tRNA---protein transferase
MERKVFTELRGTDTVELHEALAKVGFRRSQNVAYRPSCEACTACVSVRVLAGAFKPNATMRKLIRQNADITVSACEPWATDEQFELLKRYLSHRHPKGGMADMDVFDFAEMVERTPVNTLIYEYRAPVREGEKEGKLIGVCITDQVSDGFSMVYSFFDPDCGRPGLGTYIILDHILRAAAAKLPYVYLGYWIRDCKRMAYKVRFEPHERLTATGWVKQTKAL